jgi:hypothetical protein
MALQITLQSLEIGKRALRWDKAKLHQSAGGIVDEHQKRAGCRPIFEPAMVRAVDLDQLAKMLGCWMRLRSARGSQIPARRIQPRNVSRDTRTSWRSKSFSAANVGPKSA